jgi:hypothetical protein
MGFLAPALPWIGKGAALIGGWLGGKKAQSSAMQRSPEELAALGGAQGAAGSLGRMGSSLLQGGQQTLGQGTGMLGSAGNYWQTLLGGNRAAMSQATAGPRAALTDQYRGAERGLERSGLRGGVRDLASAELSRDRAGKIAGLTTGVQPFAAQQLAGVGSELGSLGTSQAGLGVGAAGAGGQLWSRLLGEGFDNRRYGRAEGEHASTSIGSLIFDILSGLGGKKSPLSSKQTVPNSTTWMPGGASRTLF